MRPGTTSQISAMADILTQLQTCLDQVSIITPTPFEKLLPYPEVKGGIRFTNVYFCSYSSLPNSTLHSATSQHTTTTRLPPHPPMSPTRSGSWKRSPRMLLRRHRLPLPRTQLLQQKQLQAQVPRRVTPEAATRNPQQEQQAVRQGLGKPRQNRPVHHAQTLRIPFSLVSAN